MPLIFAAIAPHGFPIIPDLSDDGSGALATRAAMEELGQRATAAGVEALVIAGPDGVRVEGAICLPDTARAAGTLAWQGRQVELNVPVDGPLTDAIAAKAKERGIPIARAGYGGNRRDQSVLPLDWGILTPLWFLGHGRNMPGLGNVLADPPADDVGRAVAEVSAAEPRRIGFIASCDWGHAHAEVGPYGFHDESARVDAEVVAAVQANDLMSLMDLDERRAQDAAIDGLWQAPMLLGAFAVTPMNVELLSYEAPTYYGMLVAVRAP